MRSIEHARAKAREMREALGVGPGDAVALMDKLRQRLERTHEIELLPMRREAMDGNRALVDTEAKVLKYDQTIVGANLLLLLAHELGHIELHARLRDANETPDLLAATAYADAGAAAVSRYSPRTYEEAEATAFALEFVCPSNALWDAWEATRDRGGGRGGGLEALAQRFGCTVDVVRIQLAHGLHIVALGGLTELSASKPIEFTKAQREAARFVGAPAIVDAGPGTGKTATVTLRLQCLMNDYGAKASQVLALTFSNEAARELMDRVAGAFGSGAANEMKIQTFHGFGMEFLHHHGHLVGYTERFRLLDEDAQAELVSELLGRIPCDKLLVLRDPFETAQRVVEHINYCKHRLITPEDLERELRPWAAEIEVRAKAAVETNPLTESGKKRTPKQLEGALAKARGDRDDAVRNERETLAAARQLIGMFRAYEDTKLSTQAIDFADLIAIPIGILKNHPKVGALYQQQFPWVIVDEFQDVTRATSALLRALCGKPNPPWVVGDARQAIYQFLGAAPENVAQFANDFPGAKGFPLDVNYRSSQPVVTAANQLAMLLERPDARAEEMYVRWTPGLKIEALGERSVSVAVAASDASEVEGVAAQVKAWIDSGVEVGDIAVLARRHVDVRNVILALKGRGIVAQASGLLTSEGAAGDLAAVLTLADAPGISIMRVAFALGRGRVLVPAINATVAAMLAEMRGDIDHVRGGKYDAALDAEVKAVYHAALEARHSCDGFTALANFLFEDSAYLRRILDAPDSAERAMTLVEIVSSLSVATSYRSTHPRLRPAEARLGFAERFRERLLRTFPIPLAPKARRDAVHVMTCHAAKGLEFPCVIVVGQTMPPTQMLENYEWIAPMRRPEVSRELQQANSLLFVGVTRAQRAVVVSYPERANAGTSGKGKTAVPLLERWCKVFGIHTVRWATEGPPMERVIAGNVWDAPMRKEIKASAMDKDACPLLTYLEVYHRGRFPERTREMYPLFFGAVRASLRKVAALAIAAGAGVPLTDLEAIAVLDAEWPPELQKDHPHAAMYRDLAMRMVVGFARVFIPVAGAHVDLGPEVRLGDGGLDARLDLIAHFRQPDGSVVAIAFRPQSIAREPGELKWSALDRNKRVSLVLLEDARPGISPKVYSGVDQRLHDYKWSRDEDSLPKEARELKARRDAFARGDFSGGPSKFNCDGCRVRTSCPHWIGALEGYED